MECTGNGIVSQGQFCIVLEIDGVLICRGHIYLDPEFTRVDQDGVDIA